METIQDEQSRIKLVSWPSPQDYNEAVQNLGHSLLDPELRRGTAELNALGLPKPNSGSFASVYKISVGTNDWALRCFLHNRPDQYERYKILHSHLECVEQLDCLMSFSYLAEGIKVHGRTLPILKMSWAAGVQLIEYIEANLHSAEHLGALRDEFKKQMQNLESVGIAHGDLQHGNILVQDDNVQFVDYDGMYVSSLKSLGSLELGHRNFQHPKRTREHFGPWLDNFPAWVIYCSLTCLIYDTTLWNELGAGDECLLFRCDDFLNPLESRAFYVLENHVEEQVRLAAKYLRSLLDYELAEIPYLDEFPHEVRDMPEIIWSGIKAETRQGTQISRINNWKPDTSLPAPPEHPVDLLWNKVVPIIAVLVAASGIALVIGWVVMYVLSVWLVWPFEHARIQARESSTEIEQICKALSSEVGTVFSADGKSYALDTARPMSKPGLISNSSRTEVFEKSAKELRDSGKTGQSRIVENFSSRIRSSDLQDAGSNFAEVAMSLEIGHYPDEAGQFYIRAARAYLENGVLDTDSLLAIGKASIALLKNSELSVLSDLNQRIHLLIQSKKALRVSSIDLSKLQRIYELNAKAIDAMVRASW